MAERVWLVVTLLAFVIFPMAAQAGGIGNRADLVPRGKLLVGGEYERVFDRDVEVDEFLVQVRAAGVTLFAGSSLPPGRKFRNVELDSHRGLAKVTYGLTDWLNVYLKTGASDVDGQLTVTPGPPTLLSGPGRNNFEADGEGAFTIGGGLKVRFYQSKSGLKVLGDFQFLHYQADGKAEVNGVALPEAAALALGPGFTATGKGRGSLREAQFAVYVLQKLGPLTPYLGVKWSGADSEIKFKVNFFFLGAPLFNVKQRFSFMGSFLKRS